MVTANDESRVTTLKRSCRSLTGNSQEQSSLTDMPVGNGIFFNRALLKYNTGPSSA
jgi:hypothetical protein